MSMASASAAPTGGTHRAPCSPSLKDRRATVGGGARPARQPLGATLSQAGGTTGPPRPSPRGASTPRRPVTARGVAPMGAGRALWGKKAGAPPPTPRQGRGSEVGGCALGFTIQALTQVTLPPPDRLGLSFLDYSNDLAAHEALFSAPHRHRALAVARAERRPRVYLQFCAHCRDHTPHLDRAWEVLASVIQACPDLDYAQALPPHLPTPLAAPSGAPSPGRVEHYLYPKAHKYRPIRGCSEIYMVCQPWGGGMRTLKVTDPQAAVEALQNLLPEVQEANLSLSRLRVRDLPKRLLRGAPSPFLKVRVGECEQATPAIPSTRAPSFPAPLAFRVDQPGRQILEVEVWSDAGGGRKQFLGGCRLDLSGLQCGQVVEREARLHDTGLGGGVRGLWRPRNLGVLTCELTALGEPFEGAEALSAQSPSLGSSSPPSPPEGQRAFEGWGGSVGSLPSLEMDVLDAALPTCPPDFSATIG